MGIIVHLLRVVLSKFYEVLAIASIKACEVGVGVIGLGAPGAVRVQSSGSHPEVIRRSTTD